jgi:hypothetical protein
VWVLSDVGHGDSSFFGVSRQSEPIQLACGGRGAPKLANGAEQFMAVGRRWPTAAAPTLTSAARNESQDVAVGIGHPGDMRGPTDILRCGLERCPGRHYFGHGRVKVGHTDVGH